MVSAIFTNNFTLYGMHFVIAVPATFCHPNSPLAKIKCLCTCTA